MRKYFSNIRARILIGNGKMQSASRASNLIITIQVTRDSFAALGYQSLCETKRNAIIKKQQNGIDIPCGSVIYYVQVTVSRVFEALRSYVGFFVGSIRHSCLFFRYKQPMLIGTVPMRSAISVVSG